MLKIIQNKKITGSLFGVWTLLIIILSVIPGTPEMKIVIEDKFTLRLDYLLHSLIYFGFGNLFIFWISNYRNPYKLSNLLLFLLIAIFFASSTEYIQSIIPDRSFNMYDLYSNNLGLFSGIIISLIILKKKFI